MHSFTLARQPIILKCNAKVLSDARGVDAGDNRKNKTGLDLI